MGGDLRLASAAVCVSSTESLHLPSAVPEFETAQYLAMQNAKKERASIINCHWFATVPAGRIPPMPPPQTCPLGWSSHLPPIARSSR
jgi:hypothetical protein